MLQNRETIPVTVPVELTFTARWPIVSQQPLELGLRVCPVTAPDFVCVEVHGYIPRRKLEGRRRVCRSGTGAVTGGILADGGRFGGRAGPPARRTSLSVAEPAAVRSAAAVR